MPKFSLCWDCERSYKKTCSWAKRFVPVQGWTAEERVILGTHCTPNTISYRVDACPLFVRDGYNGGMYREGEKHVISL